MIDEKAEATQLNPAVQDVPPDKETLRLLHQTIRRALEMCAADAKQKGLQLRTRLDAGHEAVSADGARLQQVFWNLLKNAIKFSPEGGHVDVITENASDGRLRIRVVDGGIGIAPEHLAVIFNAYEQADAAVTREFGGLGLGLAVCKAVIDQHGGRIAAPRS